MALKPLDGDRQIVVATGNKGKLRELRSLLGQQWVLIPQSDLGISPVAETGTTFAENALIKARHASGLADMPAIADDSGLEVDALDGAPGIRSARYSGATGEVDAANNARLLAELGDLPEAKRSARFRCVVVFIRCAGDPDPVFAEGAWEGHIASQPAGDSGFGYDPIFIDAGTGLSAAQMPPNQKNGLSHRGGAVRRLSRAMDALSPVSPR
jgi:XTP/dITP diphosphohydrolase